MQPLDSATLANKEYVAEQYRRWKADPASVGPEWGLFFAGFELAADGANGALARVPQEAPAGFLDVYDLVHSYRELGHLVAHLNPLDETERMHPLLDPSEFGFGEPDFDRVVNCAGFRGCARATVRELIVRLRETYCRTIGVEYMHIQDQEQRVWLQDRIERNLNRPELGAEDRLRILDRLVEAEGFERFLQLRYPTAKRFSLEGCDALIPLLDTLIEDAGGLGVEEMVFGMPHRGRLNVLANVVRKPYEMVLAEFEGSLLAKEATGDGDVKYHLGYSNDRTTRGGAKVHLSLCPNPSHLEAVDPIVEGIVSAKQYRRHDAECSQVVPVLLHGDAAFTGQGVVSETLGLSELAGYRTGGSVHVIINNQIGFTTPPEAYRPAPYPSEVAKIIGAPVFHVNADDPEAAVQAARLAIGFRQRFKKDVIVDLVGYRRHGHNELDDPTYTQPVMYRKIAQQPTALALYRGQLVSTGVASEEDAERRQREFRELLDDAQGYARDFMPRQQIFVFGGLWRGLGWAGDDWSARTAVARETLDEVAAAFARVPAGFTPHPRVARLMAERAAMVREGRAIDWSTAEALAIGTLLLEHVPVRLSGQDTARGTFSQRHAVLHDVETDERYVPLDNIRGDQEQARILDSMLSENAVLGFEFGMTLADPHRLVCWEAQFGDFANGAQIVIDQFLVSSESKWQRMSGLVLLLPHGYEGQGPEHSSARLERFLQLCAEDNVQVCYPTTPAQYFHALRRQMHRNFRKPLVVMTPKSLLRHKLCVSSIAEFTDATFEPVLDDVAVGGAPEAGVTVERAKVQRLLLCSGKLYYALLGARRERAMDSVGIVRVEELYPFPFRPLEKLFAAYPEAHEIVWVQEEPWNMGSWHFVYHRLRRILPDRRQLSYVGRAEAASPATGSYKIHQQEEAELVNRAFAR
ncbi:MAG TPA: 2-oxoglutarate dehydrogenase E1 component [Gaiellaceae bacterium]|nr:2-oxoglutarate dehydrogenase E1 component [Gaiellaceae bacterium]